MRPLFESLATYVLFLILCCVVHSGAAAQQSPDPVSSDLATLAQTFVDEARQGKSLDSLLSPDVAGSARQAQLKRVQSTYLDLEISGYRNLEVRGANRADITADIYWRTIHSDFRQTATLHFQRVNGRWYLADFDFMTFNWAYALIGAAIGVVWAVFVLRSLFDWRKRQFSSSANKLLWLIVIFVPLIGVPFYWMIVARTPGRRQIVSA